MCMVGILLSGLHSELTTPGQVTPEKIKMENKTVVATAGKPLVSLRSVSPFPAVPHL